MHCRFFDMPHDDPEFDSLHLNSVIVSRVPEEVIATDKLEEGEWTNEESVSTKGTVCIFRHTWRR